jgi:hypothetical protein
MLTDSLSLGICDKTRKHDITNIIKEQLLGKYQQFVYMLKVFLVWLLNHLMHMGITFLPVCYFACDLLDVKLEIC